MRWLDIFKGLKSEMAFQQIWQDCKSYRFSFFRFDLFSAFSVALLTIPQSIAYAYLAGLPPSAGLYSALFATIFTGAFSSSSFLIAGPSTGVAILIQTAMNDVLSTYYPTVIGAEREVLIMNILMHIVLLLGLLQLIGSLLNIGKLLQFVSTSVILGYFSGVVIAIIVNQLFHFTGIVPSKEQAPGALFRLIDFFRHIFELRGEIVLIGGMSMLFLLLMKWLFPKLPGPLLMLIFAGIATYFLNDWFLESTYLKPYRFHIQNIKDSGISGALFLSFRFPMLDLKILNQIFFPSFAISLLSIFEVFSVSRAVGEKCRRNILLNQDIFSLGISNAFLSFFLGTMPASGSLSRSLLNCQSGAKTRFSAMLSSIFVAFFIFFAWHFVEYIPLASLAALLIVIVPTLIDFKELRFCLRATRGDVVVFSFTFLSCLVFNLYTAFFLGIIISIASFLRKVAVPHLVEYAFNAAGRLTIVSPSKKVSRKVRIIGVGGEMFFAAVNFFQKTLREIAEDPHVEVIVLRLHNVYYMDASMCLTLLRLHDYIESIHHHLVISGITEEVWATFSRTGLINKLGKENLFLSDEMNPQLSTWRACIRAREFIEKD